MKKILIVDASKASLVMTSEVFKDHYPGIQVIVATNSLDALKLAKQHIEIDAFIIDFDLPDNNGAETAIQLKNLYPTPILITAFDSPRVQQLIDTSLSQYADCQNWLKKPVDPDVVIAVAQRFCDGKMRIQKRISCQLPAFAELTLKNPLSSKTTGRKTKTENSTYLYGIIEDCSLNGIKFKPRKHSKMNLNDWNDILKNMELISPDDPITIVLQVNADIQTNVHNKIFNTIPASPSSVMMEKNKKYELTLQKLSGKIAWASSESGEWGIGIEFEDEMLSKRLFESIVTSQSKRQLQPQTFIKTLKGSSHFQIKKKKEM